MKVAVLGGGPGGYVCAIRAAQLGADVTIIEKHKFGGTCLNVGCIPTKVLLHTAKIYKTLREEAEDLGLSISDIRVKWDKLQHRKAQVVEQLVGGVNTLLETNKIQKVIGEGRFISVTKIEVTSPGGKRETIEFDKAVIATGSFPTIVPIPGIDLEGVLTSDEALSLEHIPESICIIGGGVIGTEFASIYSSVGSKVTIVEMLPDIVANMDKDIVDCLKNQLMESGVHIYTRTRAESIEKIGNKLKVNIITDSGNKEVITAEKVLLSVGRRPNTQNIGLEEIGIETSSGAIVVDKRMKTNVDNIYAIGDCTGGVLLAHVALAQGMVAADNMMGKRSDMDFKTVPYCVYTKPELAAVGLTEEEAKKQGYKVKTGIFPLYANGKSLIMGETNGIVKYVVDANTDEILGLHIAGPQATELIVKGSLAIRLEATLDEIISTVHAHPTVAEALNEAALSVYGKAIHLP